MDIFEAKNGKIELFSKKQSVNVAERIQLEFHLSGEGTFTVSPKELFHYIELAFGNCVVTFYPAELYNQERHKETIVLRPGQYSIYTLDLNISLLKKVPLKTCQASLRIQEMQPRPFNVDKIQAIVTGTDEPVHDQNVFDYVPNRETQCVQGSPIRGTLSTHWGTFSDIKMYSKYPITRGSITCGNKSFPIDDIRGGILESPINDVPMEANARFELEVEGSDGKPFELYIMSKRKCSLNIWSGQVQVKLL